MSDLFFAMLSIFLVVLVGIRGVCVEDTVARDALAREGFTNVRVTDRAFFFVGFRGCDITEAVRIIVVATDPRGVDVPVYVCAGWPLADTRIVYRLRRETTII